MDKEKILNEIENKIVEIMDESHADIVIAYSEEVDDDLYQEDYSVYGTVNEINEFICKLNDIEFVGAHDNDEIEEELEGVEDYDEDEDCICVTVYTTIDLQDVK